MHEIENDALRKIKKKYEQLKQSSNIYIAHKHDGIDKALANYLNAFPERGQLKILFLRESEGVYQFGARRVYIKIEKGNNIVVRVGGGYMDIDTFLNHFTEAEVTRILRKHDVLQRFQNKLKA